MLAGLGGGDSSGAALTTVDAHNPTHQEDIVDSAPEGDLNDADRIDTGMDSAMAQVQDECACASQASMPSAPVSAAVSAATSSADLHAQEEGGSHDSKDESNKSNEENGELDNESDGPSVKRSRHE